jgi:hypothetical protein
MKIRPADYTINHVYARIKAIMRFDMTATHPSIGTSEQ